MVDEPIAISRAIGQMIRSVNSNNKIFKDATSEMISSLRDLKTVLQLATSNLRADAKKQQQLQRGTIKEQSNGPNDNSLLLKILNAASVGNIIATNTLNELRHLTNATTIDETEIWRKSVLNALALIATNSGGVLPHLPKPPIRPPTPSSGGAAKAAENDAENIAEGAAGAEVVEGSHGTKTVARGSRGVGRLGTIFRGAGSVLTGGVRLAAGLGGAYLGYSGAANINSGAQNKPFFGGSQGVVGSTAANYAESIGGDALAGASIAGPWGALIGGGVGLGAALYREFSPQINKFLGSTFTKAKGLVVGITDWLTNNMPSWDTIKSGVNSVGFDVSAFMKRLNAWEAGANKSVNDWLDANFPDFTNAANKAQSQLLNGNVSGAIKTINAWQDSTTKAVSTWVDNLLNSFSMGLKDDKGITNAKNAASEFNTWAQTINKNVNAYIDKLFNPSPANNTANSTTAANTNPLDAYPTPFGRGGHNGGMPPGTSDLDILGKLYDWLTSHDAKPQKGFNTPDMSNVSFITGGSGAGILQAAYTTPGTSPGYDPSTFSYNPYGGSSGTNYTSDTGAPVDANGNPIGGSLSPNVNTSASTLASMIFGSGKDAMKIPSSQIPDIMAAAKKYGVDPRVIASVFYRESRFNPTLSNHSMVRNAQGQLVHSSAKGEGQFINGTAKSYLDGRNIFAPGVAADMTGHYLHDLLKGSGGNYNKALLGYTGNNSVEVSQLENDSGLNGSYNNQAPMVAQQPYAPGQAPDQQLAARHNSPAKQAITPPAGTSSGASFVQAAYTPSSGIPSINDIPMHITTQGLILVNHGTGMI